MDCPTPQITLKKTVTRSFIRISGFVLFFLAALGTSQYAHAATLFFSPGSKTVNEGDIFSVSVIVNTNGVSINSAEAVLRFPSEFLEVVSVSKSGSIFSLWVEEPSFSNSDGTVSFSGGAPNPGYTGSGGRLVTATFRAKHAGTATVLFDSATVRANDGLGTNVLTASGSSAFDITGKIATEKPVVPPVEPKQKPPAPTTPVPPSTTSTVAAMYLTSPTHADQTRWYRDASPHFAWSLPPDVIEVQTLLSKASDAVPRISNIPPVDAKTVEGIDDGVWYFAVRARTVPGWSQIARYRVQIDTAAPAITNLTEQSESVESSGVARFAIAAHDELSGVDHFEIAIDGGAAVVWNGSGLYDTPALGAGKHTLVATVFDVAGNKASRTASFTVTAPNAPQITKYDTFAKTDGYVIVVQGTALPESRVSLSVGHVDAASVAMFNGSADQDGYFTIIVPTITESGVYAFWVESVTSGGVKSAPSTKEVVVLRGHTPAILTPAGAIATGAATAAGLFSLLQFVAWYWRRRKSLRMAQYSVPRNRKPPIVPRRPITRIPSRPIVRRSPRIRSGPTDTNL